MNLLVIFLLPWWVYIYCFSFFLLQDKGGPFDWWRVGKVILKRTFRRHTCTKKIHAHDQHWETIPHIQWTQKSMLHREKISCIPTSLEKNSQSMKGFRKIILPVPIGPHLLWKVKSGSRYGTVVRALATHHWACGTCSIPALCHEKKNAVYYFQISLFVPEILKFLNYAN